MTAQDSPPNPTASTPAAAPLAQAGSASAVAAIDWREGRIVGWALPETEGDLCAVVEVWLDGQCIHRVVADQPVMPLRAALGTLALPPREHAAFALRLPQARLRPGVLQRTADTALALRRQGGAPFFEATLHGANELLQLTDGLPQDQLYRVHFHGLADGAVLRGEVSNRFGPGAPELRVRVNGEAAPAPALIPDGSGRVHAFEIPLASAGLAEGHNLIEIQTADGHPLIGYPIHIGPASVGETERRLAAVEAQLAFLKHMVLHQGDSQTSERAQLKAEIVHLCSDMLALQRANLEREWAVSQGARRLG